MGGKATLLASGTVGSKDKCRAIYQGGRWWLLECRTAKGQALSADLKGALIGGAKAIPSVAIGASAGAELHIRKLPTDPADRSEEHTSELQSLMRISYAVFCLKTKTKTNQTITNKI